MSEKVLAFTRLWNIKKNDVKHFFLTDLGVLWVSGAEGKAITLPSIPRGARSADKVL